MSADLTIITPSNIANIRNLLTSLSLTDLNGTNIEVEARFGYFDGSRFNSGVTRGTFNRIKQDFSTYNYDYTHSKDEIFRDSTSNNWPFDTNSTERYTTVYRSDGSIDQIYRLIKSRVQNFDVPQYSIRLSVAKETIDQQSPPSTSPIMFREKKRWSYQISQNQFRIDLTEVTTYRLAENDPRQAKTVYEVEVEIMEPKLQNLENFNVFIGIILAKIQGTQIIYQSQEKSEIISKINNYIGSHHQSSRNIDLSAIIQPRNLKIRDLSIGSIVPRSIQDIRYTVTIKADGKRKLLFIDPKGIYLVYADEVMKIAGTSVASKLNTWHGTVFECEYIPKENLKSDADPKYRAARIYVTIYDTLAVGGQSKVRNESLLTRLEYAQRFTIIVQQLKSIIIEVKTFRSFSNVNEFYQMVNEIQYSNTPFETDGLIFTPDNYRYDPSVNYMKLKDRILHRQPDILKWKPPSQLTIDFAIRHVSSLEGNSIELLSSEGNRYVPFSGKPFNPLINIQMTPELQNSPNNSVIEFRWNYEDSNEETLGKFVYVRNRTDKAFPNRQEVALDVWKDIQSPIDEKTITGQKFSLAFRYHNREKWKLFNAVGTELPSNLKHKVLLDIGSGRGGDVMKWIQSGFTHLICVEPSESNRLELINRLESIRREQPYIQYIIIPTIGQDVNTIIQMVRKFSPNGYVHAISYMLSLSFFFDTPESSLSILQLVHETLMSGGYFFALTIDGEYVLEYFNNVSNHNNINGVLRSYMQLIDFELRPPTDDIRSNHVYINIPNSIVQNQTEYLTNITGLINALENNIPTPLKLISKWRTNQELFLIPEEIQYTGLFTAFIMKRA